MTKKSVVVWISVGASILFVCGGSGAYYIHSQSVKKAASLRQALLSTSNQESTDPAATMNLQQTSGDMTVPLGGSTAPKQDTNSLKVDNSYQPNAAVQGQAPTQNQPNSNGGSSNSAKLPGPETFTQYDQYKDGQTALFGDATVGSGKEVGATTKVAVLYKGWLTNGQLFDQSQTDPSTKQLQPFIFTMGEHKVITGWEQAIFGMKVGGTRRLIIPPAVGYGPTGQGPIPGNAVLVFDVQLIDAQ